VLLLLAVMAVGLAKHIVNFLPVKQFLSLGLIAELWGGKEIQLIFK